jgi:hypothetical protein
MTRKILSTLCLLGLSFTSSPALGLKSDIKLYRLHSGEGTNTVADNQRFKDLATDVGAIVAATPITSADTLGAGGFELGVSGHVAKVDNAQSYWVDAVQDQDPSGSYQVVEVRARKGLPFSFELGGQFSYLVSTEMTTVGADLRYAPWEGMPKHGFPDIALRVSFIKLVGGTDLNISNIGGDLTISKRFPISGVVNLTPFGGYQLFFTRASSNEIDTTPGNGDDNTNIRFNNETIAQHQGFLGGKFSFGTFSTYMQIGLTPTVQTYSFKLGWDL